MKFSEGDKVTVYSHYGSLPHAITTVKKVYKNGNFVLNRREGQFRQGGWAASGRGGRVALATDEEIIKFKRLKAQNLIKERITYLSDRMGEMTLDELNEQLVALGGDAT